MQNLQILAIFNIFFISLYIFTQKRLTPQRIEYKHGLFCRTVISFQKI